MRPFRSCLSAPNDAVQPQTQTQQVLSPGSPNYLYEGCLRTDDISFRESKPYVGVMRDSSGYLLCQVQHKKWRWIASKRQDCSIQIRSEVT